MFAKQYENPGTLSNILSNGMIGFMLDTMDLVMALSFLSTLLYFCLFFLLSVCFLNLFVCLPVHLPLFTSGFYYLLLVNFKDKLFEVLYPNKKIHLVSEHASIAIGNFKMSFKLAYKHSVVQIDTMETIFRSVCSSEREYESFYHIFFLFYCISNDIC
jgi:ABC-type molybdate transport system permease subunit